MKNQEQIIRWWRDRERSGGVVRLTLTDLIIPVVWFSAMVGFVAPSFIPHYPLVSMLVLVATIPGYVALAPFVY